MTGKPRVVLLRGHRATPWSFAPWRPLLDRFDVEVLLTGRDPAGRDDPGLPTRRIATWGSALPGGRLGDAIVNVLNDRYVGLSRHLADADIVHAEELGSWAAAHPARLRARSESGWKLAVTVWETIPTLDAYRHRHARRYRRRVIEAADLFLPTTSRAADALRLEGVPDSRIRVCAPGVDRERFHPASDAPAPAEHVILSPGRLVWEKGHQDVLRAVAALERGLVEGLDPAPRVRVRIEGAGPERDRLARHAEELGLAERVTFGSSPHAGMPERFREASCVVLASLPAALKPYHVWDRPRIFWEEQFGMVLVEALAAGCPIVASRSGAIPEVLEGTGAGLYDPGDWRALATLLARGPLRRPPGERATYPEERVAFYSATAAAERLADAYASLIGS